MYKGTEEMGRIILSTGRYAKKPFYVEKFCINLYSVEELCYLLVEKAEMLDTEIMQRELVQWLDEQCGLNQLAHALYSLLNQNGSTAAFAGIILEYVNLYPADVVAGTEAAIKGSEGLNPYERKKAKADYMLQNRRYYGALKQYYALLEQMPDTDKQLSAKILHNMGVAYAKLFMFRQAAGRFRQAYETDGEKESLALYLASVRLYSRDKEYISFIAEHPEYHNVSLQVERQMEQAEGLFEATEENRMLFTLQVFKEEGNCTAGNDTPYYREIERLTDRLKEQYREYVS